MLYNSNYSFTELNSLIAEELTEMALSGYLGVVIGFVIY